LVKKNNIAIIPARGGSKRIPQKNIIDFFGKPMIAWTIEAAQQSGIFDRILVSTDDEEIAQVARSFGIEVPFLRDKHYDDDAPVSDGTITALEQLKEQLGEEYHNIFQLMPNCPLRKKEQIIDAYNHFSGSGALFQISCFKFGWMNPRWAVELDEKLQPRFIFPEAFEKRSQDMGPLYCPSGAIWIARESALMSFGSFYGKPLTFYPIDWKNAIDIDDLDDLEMTKVLFSVKADK